MSLQRRARRNLPRSEHTYTTHRREFPESVPSSRPNSANSEESYTMGHPGNHHGYTPAPPPRPPSARSNRRSSNVRPPSRESTSYNLYEGPEQKGVTGSYSRDAYSRASTMSLSRPSSSLSKYTPLPPIGHQASFEGDIGDTGDITNSMRKLQVSVRVPSPNVTEQQLTNESIHLSYNPGTAGFVQRPSSKSYVSAGKSKDKIHSPTGDGHNINVMNCGEPVTHKSHRNPVSSPRKPGDGQSSLALAVKLPDGQRFQRSFLLSASLGSVVKYVEAESGKNFDGFSLIQNSPKKVFSDLSRTLAECALEDRTLLYLDTDD